MPMAAGGSDANRGCYMEGASVPSMSTQTPPLSSELSVSALRELWAEWRRDRSARSDLFVLVACRPLEWAIAGNDIALVPIYETADALQAAVESLLHHERWLRELAAKHRCEEQEEQLDPAHSATSSPSVEIALVEGVAGETDSDVLLLVLRDRCVVRRTFDARCWQSDHRPVRREPAVDLSDDVGRDGRRRS